MKQLKLTLAVMALLAVSGCSPTNYEACVDDASTRPTELGVKVARQQCYEKFKKPAELAAAAERDRAIAQKRAEWLALNVEGMTLEQAKKTMGEPTYVIEPVACAPDSSGSRTAPKSCAAIQWRQEPSKMPCGFIGGVPGRRTDDTACYFSAHFETSKDWAKLWVLFAEPF